MILRRTVSLALAAALVWSPASADSLREALAHAYSSNPTIAAERANLRITNEQYAQAQSLRRPRLSASGSYGYRDSEQIGSALPGGALEPSTFQLNVAQPLFRGGRVPAALNQAEARILAARANLQATVQEIFLEGVTAYLDVLTNARIVEIRLESVRALATQAAAAETRLEYGEVTRTDVAQARSRLSLARASLSSAQAEYRTARANYEQVFGFPPMSLEPPDPLPPMPSDINEARQTAVNWNPELIATRYVEEASRHGVDIAQADLWPEVTVNATASRRNDINFRGDREDAAAVIARVDIPLYSGGFERSQIRAAKEQVSRDRLRVQRGERLIVEEVAAAWNAWHSAQAIVESAEDAVQAARVAVSGVNEEFSYGFRTTLDILVAEDDLREAQIRLANARRQEYVSANRLLSVMGLLSVEYLDLPIREYDPQEDLDRIKGKILSTSIEP